MLLRSASSPYIHSPASIHVSTCTALHVVQLHPSLSYVCGRTRIAVAITAPLGHADMLAALFPFCSAVPFILCGRWGVTPCPRKVPLVYVVGKPIPVPPHTPGEQVKHSDVSAVHKQYYDSLVDLFHRYKHLHPNFANAKLVLTAD